MSLSVDPVPIADDLLNATNKKMAGSWYRWLGQVVARTLAASSVVAAAHRAGVAASIGATTLVQPSQPADFRVSWTVQVTQPATTSSSIAVTLTWKANNVTQTKAFTALTGNSTTTNDSGLVFIRPDSGQPIQYSATYASVGATPMLCTIDLVAEQLT